MSRKLWQVAASCAAICVAFGATQAAAASTSIHAITFALMYSLRRDCGPEIIAGLQVGKFLCKLCGRLSVGMGMAGRRGQIAATFLALACIPVLAASAGTPVRVALAGKLAPAVTGRAWTVKLGVRPASFRGAVHVIATGAKRIDVRATGGRGSYRARFVFPSAGRWTLTARAGGTTSRLGR